MSSASRLIRRLQDLQSTAETGFPVVLDRATGEQATDSTTHVITMPAGIVGGMLLVVAFACDNDPTVTASAGWVKMGQGTFGTDVTGAVFWKTADGGDTCTVTTSTAQGSSHVAWLINGGQNPVGTVANGTGGTANPPANTPIAGSLDYLWIAMAANPGNLDIGENPPTSYGNFTQVVATSDADGATITTAERELNNPTQNPVGFSASTSPWVAWTLAVEPGPTVVFGTVTSTLPPLTSSTDGALEVTGTLTATLPALTSSFAGTITAGAITGTMPVTLPALAAASAGTVEVAGTQATTLPALSASLTGTLEVAGTQATTLPPLAATMAGAVEVAGTVAATLPALSANFTGTVGVSGVSGTMAVTLPPLTATTTGTVKVTGTTSATLPHLTGTMTGASKVTGTTTATLPPLLITSAGEVTVEGTTAATLPALSATFTGSVPVIGTVAVTLPALQFAFAGLVIVEVTPAERTMLVRAESRTRGVRADPRALVVRFESRTTEVPHELPT